MMGSKTYLVAVCLALFLHCNLIGSVPVGDPGGSEDCPLQADVAECQPPTLINVGSDEDPRNGSSSVPESPFEPCCDSEGRVCPSKAFCKFAIEHFKNVKEAPSCNSLASKDGPEGQTLLLLLNALLYGIQSFQASLCINFRWCPLEENRVCGTDGRTYINECQLQLTACSMPALRLKILHFGECRGPADVRNGLARPGDRCPMCNPDEATGAVCGTDGKTYSTKCFLERKRCLNRSNLQIRNLGACRHCAVACPAIYMPVCGSDGRTYPNQCELDRRVCLFPYLELRTKHKGPCWGRFGQDGAPTECSFQCPTKNVPACGTDGNTYFNPCELYREACLRPHRNLRLDHLGFCYSGQGDELCPDRCERKKDLVCGTDGFTYHNLCFLKMQACQTGDKSLEAAENGTCVKDPSVCCSWDCPGVAKPVCGPDSHDLEARSTFTNKCYLYKEACFQCTGSINVLEGSCDSVGPSGRDGHLSGCRGLHHKSGQLLLCSFPFIYNGKKHYKCTRDDHNARWCATETYRNRVMVPGEWGNCNQACGTVVD